MSIRRELSAFRLRRSPRAWLALLAVTLVGSVGSVGAGCAGSDSSESNAPDGALKIRIISTSPTFTDLPMVVILAQDYFAKVGLDADVEFGASNASLITQTVISGDADVGSSGAGSLYNAYAEGATQLVSLGSSNPSITFGLALNQKTLTTLAERGVTPRSPVRDRVQALRGLNLTTSPQGSTGNAYLRIMLSEYGLDPDRDVTIIPNNDGTAQIATTRQGRADGVAQSFPRANFPEAEGWGGLWLNWSVDLPSLLPLAAHDYYTSRSWLESHREEATRVMQALWLAQRDLQNPSDELREEVRALPEFRELNEDAFDAGWELAVGAYKGATPLTTEEMFEHQVELVNYNRDSPITFGFDDIYDLSAAEAARP
ncbi:nitrate ABC transporter substrate-binding protein [Frankia sp. R43]|uniref:ABC transporter substrate-binding protein n=1 Tax=Frankia sp. R43 TaxID=269536 RepID=UPI0006CA36FF|nr:ABC transporter substrate-binding protein [Frankia sp. R43]KPM54405.1 nitrate ABC transporter substrate-binding protein [Frankia sp. R43]